MEKRDCKRIPVNLDIEFRCHNMISTGTITDLSEKGMFICTEEICFPHDWQLEILIKSEKMRVHVIADIKRLTMNPSSNSGIGVEVVAPSMDYLNLVNGLKAVV